VTRPRVVAPDFERVEREAQVLRARLHAGELTQEDVKTRLGELMIQDSEGRWWTVGFATGRWYVHSGENWSESDPPTRAEAGRPSAGTKADTSLPPIRSIPVALQVLALIGAFVIVVHSTLALMDPLMAGLTPDLGFTAIARPTLFVMGAAIGALLSLILRWSGVALHTRHVAIITLAWGLGAFPFSVLYWIAPEDIEIALFWKHWYGNPGRAPAGTWIGADFIVGGTVTGLVLKRMCPGVRSYIIALGWVGATIASWILLAAALPPLGWLLLVMIGGLIMFLELRRARRSS